MPLYQLYSLSNAPPPILPVHESTRCRDKPESKGLRAQLGQLDSARPVLPRRKQNHPRIQTLTRTKLVPPAPENDCRIDVVPFFAGGHRGTGGWGSGLRFQKDDIEEHKVMPELQRADREDLGMRPHHVSAVQPRVLVQVHLSI